MATCVLNSHTTVLLKSFLNIKDFRANNGAEILSGPRYTENGTFVLNQPTILYDGLLGHVLFLRAPYVDRLNRFFLEKVSKKRK